LDICCGTGVQGLTLAAFARQVEGADVNPRSVAFANLNAQLNGLAERAEFTQGNLASEKQGSFDIVVSNPPYVFMPEEDAARNREGFGGGELGLELVGRIMSDLDRLLGPDGEAHVVLTSPVVQGKSMLEPLVEEQLSGTNLGAKVTYLDYRLEGSYAAYHKAHGIGHVINCYLEISRKLPPGVQTIGLGPMSRLVNRAYVGLASLAKR
jgi:methylase of polypeptide subunit release factors